MKILVLWMRFRVLLLLCLNLGCVPYAQAAVGQMLTDTYFQNPADLGLVNKQQLVFGNLFVASSLEFNGTAWGGTGQARSNVVDFLPYLLADIRVSDKWVLGFNAVPTQYGDLDWPLDSIVAQDSTVTKAYYYLLGFQSSFQLTDRFTLGLGLHIRYNYLLELDAMVSNLGNEVNKVSAVNKGLDAGLRYKITPKHTFVAAFYTPVNKFAHGTSTLGNVTSYDFQLNVVEAAVVFVGLQHQFTEQWSINEKVLWSNWTVQNDSVLLNTTRGSFTYPTDWTDTWSYMMSSRYVFTDKIAGLASALYETNPAPNSRNAIGYPLAPVLFLSGGLDIALYKNWRMQLVYGYGFFIPNAIIDNNHSTGTISNNTQAGTLQFSYRV